MNTKIDDERRKVREILGDLTRRGSKQPNVHPKSFYSLALGADEDGFERVAAAEASTVVPRSLVLAATKGTKSS